MADTLALIVVVLAGAYLLGLACLCVASPVRGERFLASFASSAAAHYLELGARLAVGLALLERAAEMLHSNLFQFVGWVLVGTTVALLAIPWRWHQAIAKRAVPLATAHLGFFATGSAILGSFVLWSALRGAT